MPRYQFGISVSFRWPWRIGCGIGIKSDTEWGSCRCYELDLGVFVVSVFAVQNAVALVAGR